MIFDLDRQVLFQVEHYYSKDPHSTFKTETWKYSYNDIHFTFTSGSGVFSKGKIDFGSELLIKSFQEPSSEGDILDFGCGYGPIGIILAKMYRNRNISMIDINERAIQLTNQNIKQNNVDNAKAIQSDGTASFTNQEKFAAIVMNPPIRTGKAKMYELFTQTKGILYPNGELWVVIQKKQGAASAVNFLSEIFTDVNAVNRKKGYIIIKCK